MKIEVLLSTMNKKNIEELNLKERNITENILILNQIDNNKRYESKKIRMLNFRETGLSKSRNRALENASGDICLIADDDIKYKKGIFTKIRKIFEANPNIDIITFKCKKKDSKYKNISFIHNYYTINSVSSIEIAFRRKNILKKEIKFDELFGLGAKFISGEENIFLKDCLDKGLKIKFIPLIIAVHPDKSSGYKWSEGLAISKGALLYRLYGKLCYIYNLAFCIKKYHEYKNKLSFCKFLFYIYKGTSDYLLCKKMYHNMFSYF